MENVSEIWSDPEENCYAQCRRNWRNWRMLDGGSNQLYTLTLPQLLSASHPLPPPHPTPLVFAPVSRRIRLETPARSVRSKQSLGRMEANTNMLIGFDLV